MARRRSKKINLTKNQIYALVAAAVLIAGIMVYGDTPTLTGMSSETGTLTFTVTGAASFSLDDAAATIGATLPGNTNWTRQSGGWAGEMHAENDGNTDLTCTIKSTALSYVAIFGGTGTGSPTFTYYSRDDGSPSAATHIGSNSSKATMVYSGDTAVNLVTSFQFEDNQDEIYIGFEHKVATDAVAATGATTTVTITCT